MRCEEARAGYLEGGASEAALEHLSSCPQCLAHRPALEAMERVLGDPVFWAEPPPELEHRVNQLIDGGPAEPAAAGRRWRWQIIAAAAVVAIVVAGGGILAGLQPSPDWEITAAGLGPAESANVVIAGWNEEGGTRVVVAADELAAAPIGYTYQLWFISGSEPISAGTFSAADDPVQLFVGVARSDYPRVAVTLEPLDGDPAPSGIFVFDDGA